MTSLRTQPEISALFKAAESRHLTDDELQHYLKLAPGQETRVLAAQEIVAAEARVVQEVIQEIFQLYPYPQNHFAAYEKATRDITYVSIYATHAMLLEDPDWFRDKLLIWLRTILQAFEFPVRNGDPASVPYPDITHHADTLPGPVSSIYNTYARLQRKYEEALSPAAFAVMREALQQPVDLLTVH